MWDQILQLLFFPSFITRNSRTPMLSAVTKEFPMPPHEQESTEPSCPSKASIFFPIKIDNKYTIPSEDPTTAKFSSGLTHILVHFVATLLHFVLNFVQTCIVLKSIKLCKLSLPLLITTFPFCNEQIEVIDCVCPFIFFPTKP